jgi:hypothetical protein
MTLASRASRFFTGTVRSRGAGYFRAGQVHIVHGSSLVVRANVRGSQIYEVMLERDEDGLVVDCTCPYYADGNACKHIWATLLAADASPFLAPLKQGSGVLPIRFADGPRDEADLDPEDDDDDDAPPLFLVPTTFPPRVNAPLAAPAPDWELVFQRVRAAQGSRSTPRKLELAYIVERARSSLAEGVAIEIARRKVTTPKPGLSPWAAVWITRELIDELADPEDRAILATLQGALETSRYSYYSSAQFHVPPAAYELILPRICRTGRCWLQRSATDAVPLRWDDGAPWTLALRAREDTKSEDWEISAVLRREGEEAPLAEADLAPARGLVLIRGAFARCDGDAWVDALRQQPRLRVAASRRRAFLDQIHSLPRVPALDLPEGWNIPEERIAPTPRLHVHAPEPGARANTPLSASVWFDYDRLRIGAKETAGALFDAERWRVIPRDHAAEQAARERLAALGIAPASRRTRDADVAVAPRTFPSAARALLAEGWNVEAAGKLYRNARGFPSLIVSSGIDWFDLAMEVDFEGVSADTAALIAALKRGETSIVLSDGSIGLVPEEWLARYGLFAEIASIQGGRLRFRRSQLGLLDVLLASQPRVEIDERLRRARDELQEGVEITPADPPASFRGELRPYQREGLGWLSFLERLGFGGCLADDMGLGKTVQVLALLGARKARARRGEEQRAALVVAPRSLIFNWKNEAARFTPDLRVLDHTGADRRPPGAHFHEHDLVLTTYGTLRRDAEAFAKVDFAYAILDEAQAIKNDRSDTAKAARLLCADHRLALSGTPVENHLGELWSIFEFLNPGMLGRASALGAAGAKNANLSPETLALLSRALRPFILRRTKAQVAKDLPDRLEETLMCQLEGKQRALYDELRNHYRASLQRRVAEAGIARSKIHILEALLRLRQVACHAGLVDAKHRATPSAKLDALFAELPALRDSGQKALVFSQFTSLLALVRTKLDELGIRYEYLDGKTRDRAARVDRFQSDPDCPFFLVSLKAGGLGLNLTAAEYVFLLDPWWNPAVEAQAIDRAHRIGQKRPVFAYRLIAKDTIEEHIAELQSKKRALAESVIQGDGGLIRELTMEDLELLLS